MTHSPHVRNQDEKTVHCTVLSQKFSWSNEIENSDPCCTHRKIPKESIENIEGKLCSNVASEYPFSRFKACG